MRAWVIVVVLVVMGRSAGVAEADAKQALKLNTQGMQKYAKKKYSDAADLFKQAIAADATLAYAHYNLASMASLTEDFPLVITELEWCKKSADPVAAKLMAKAKADKDLERALMHPRVRELVGLPALDTMSLDAVLLERTGIWGDGPDACGPDNITVTFKKGGKFSVVGFWACNDGNSKKFDAGTWLVKDGIDEDDDQEAEGVRRERGHREAGSLRRQRRQIRPVPHPGRG
ncbi:MAG: hypothetical protein WKG01_34495 [Kofleriaceae bacterium]